MHIETRSLGVSRSAALKHDARRALDAALDRFEARVHRVRVRFIGAPGGTNVTCRIRAWCGPGPTIVVEANAASFQEAVQTAAECLNRAVQRRWARERSLRRRLH